VHKAQERLRTVDVFFKTEREECHGIQLWGAWEVDGAVVFLHTDVHEADGEHLGRPIRQCLERWLHCMTIPDMRMPSSLSSIRQVSPVNPPYRSRYCLSSNRCDVLTETLSYRYLHIIWYSFHIRLAADSGKESIPFSTTTWSISNNLWKSVLEPHHTGLSKYKNVLFRENWSPVISMVIRPSTSNHAWDCRSSTPSPWYVPAIYIDLIPFSSRYWASKSLTWPQHARGKLESGAHVNSLAFFAVSIALRNCVDNLLSVAISADNILSLYCVLNNRHINVRPSPCLR